LFDWVCSPLKAAETVTVGAGVAGATVRVHDRLAVMLLVLDGATTWSGIEAV
jgi:hypothetical protein